MKIILIIIAALRIGYSAEIQNTNEEDRYYGNFYQDINESERTLLKQLICRDKRWEVYKIGDGLFDGKKIKDIKAGKVLNSPLGVVEMDKIKDVDNGLVNKEFVALLAESENIKDEICMCGFKFELVLYEKDSEIIIMLDGYTDRIWVYTALYNRWIRIRGSVKHHKNTTGIVMNIFKNINYDSRFAGK